MFEQKSIKLDDQVAVSPCVAAGLRHAFAIIGAVTVARVSRDTVKDEDSAPRGCAA